MRIVRDRWLWLLVMAGWILLGLWLIGCRSAHQSRFHGEKLWDLDDPKECVSHFLMLFANMEQGGESGFGVSEKSVETSRGGSEKYGATTVTDGEMNWISMVCYLEDEEARHYILQCADAMAPCPIRDVMNKCDPKEMTDGVQPE